MPMNISRRVFNSVVAAVPFVGVAAAQASAPKKMVCLSSRSEVERRGRIITVTKRLVDRHELYSYVEQTNDLEELNLEPTTTLWGKVYYDPFEFIPKEEHKSMILSAQLRGEEEPYLATMPMYEGRSDRSMDQDFEECVNACIDDSPEDRHYDSIIIINRNDPRFYGVVVRPSKWSSKQRLVHSV